MAMVCALSCSLPVASSLARHPLRSSSSLFGPRLKSSVGRVNRIQAAEKLYVVVKAIATEGVDPEVIPEPSAAPIEVPVNSIAALKLQSELLKKKAKKLELRRKRLVRKRHLRKKGRWPPSKMKKNKNV